MEIIWDCVILGDIPVLWFKVGKRQLGERRTQHSVATPPLNDDVDHIVSVMPFYHFANYSKIDVHITHGAKARQQLCEQLINVCSPG